jgi:hypothetical protein
MEELKQLQFYNIKEMNKILTFEHYKVKQNERN